MLAILKALGLKYLVPLLVVGLLLLFIMLSGFGRGFLPGLGTFLVMLQGAFLLGVIIFVFLTVQKGLPWAVTTLRGWWVKGKADLGNLKGDVTDLQRRIPALEADVKALKDKVGGLA